MSGRLRAAAAQCLLLALGAACSSAPSGNGTASGGATSASGGSPGSGGNTTAPSGTGGATASSGGTQGSGGAIASGGSTGGSAGTPGSGGRASDGGAPGSGGRDSADASAGSGGKAESGGVTGRGGVTASGGTTGLAGAAGGRTGAGGARTGGSSGSGGTSGSGGAPGTGGGSAGFAASYFLGADITNAEYASATAQDSLLSQLKSHGFNAIRLRTFVDPKAADGYDRTTGCADIAHTVAFGKKVKDLGMALVVDFHYSDNWADPGKQCVPIAWQGLATIDALATAVHDYTKDSITKLLAGGARPEMVQIGNETTPGMLIHVCDGDGLPTGNNKVTGAISSWTNLGTLFKAGVKGVKDVDTKILIALHIDRCGDKPDDTQGSRAIHSDGPVGATGKSCGLGLLRTSLARCGGSKPREQPREVKNGPFQTLHASSPWHERLDRCGVFALPAARRSASAGVSRRGCAPFFLGRQYSARPGLSHHGGHGDIFADRHQGCGPADAGIRPLGPGP